MLGAFIIGVSLVIISAILPLFVITPDGISMAGEPSLQIDGWFIQTLLQLGKALIACYVFYRVWLRGLLHIRTHDVYKNHGKDKGFYFQIALMLSTAYIFGTILKAG